MKNRFLHELMNFKKYLENEEKSPVTVENICGTSGLFCALNSRFDKHV